ncbi:hypothetical protein VNI00_011041 [Paramarasmius palmivorus]|uniref:Cerato-platanin n=1 Tax=Paramarasmius palmivorus TaxID=297713 RepID=A0AAW0CG10_9AGAR
MKSFAIFTSIAILFAASSEAVKLSYDTTYDNSSGSLLTVTCSDGQNGLASEYPTFGDLPGFPHIGAASGIQWNSPDCGFCYELTHATRRGRKSIYLLAMDRSVEGFTSSRQAMDDLTGGRAVELGSIDVEVQKVEDSSCGY